ncbi:MAG: hypothetical protein ACYDD0_12415 [Candidatus Dormibacteria bacterium]
MPKLYTGDELFDLPADSGTDALSRDRMAAIQHGDESYTDSPFQLRFQAGVQRHFPL